MVIFEILWNSKILMILSGFLFVVMIDLKWVCIISIELMRNIIVKILFWIKLGY